MCSIVDYYDDKLLLLQLAPGGYEEEDYEEPPCAGARGDGKQQQGLQGGHQRHCKGGREGYSTGRDGLGEEGCQLEMGPGSCRRKGFCGIRDVTSLTHRNLHLSSSV